MVKNMAAIATFVNLLGFYKYSQELRSKDTELVRASLEASYSDQPQS